MKTTKAKEALPVIWYERHMLPKEAYTREEIVRQHPTGTIVSIRGDLKHWVAFRDFYSLKCLGDRIFWTKSASANLTFKKGRLYGSLDPFKDVLVDAFHLDWMKGHSWIQNLIASRRDLWTAVINGKITNPEMLAKYFSKKYFKGAYSYKAIKGFYNDLYGLSLWDIYYYTTNPELAVLRLIGDTSAADFTNLDINNYISLFGDALHLCAILNTKLNPMWSSRRLSEEHQKQIEIVNESKCLAYSDALIAPEFERDGLSLILDERTCFKEGYTMHNCVYSNYWKQIKKGTYLIARGEIQGEYVDLGIQITGTNDGCMPAFDQVHTIYNGNPSQEVIRLCKEWVSKYALQLCDVANKIQLNPLDKDNVEYKPVVPGVAFAPEEATVELPW